MTEINSRKRESKSVRKPKERTTVAEVGDLVMPAFSLIPALCRSDGTLS
jgi:hypothetical protein